MKFRRPLKITNRVSSITNSFVQAIIPSIEPTVDEVNEALDVLGMTLSTLKCVYCGAVATDWDHLRPLVKNKRPTGYINEIRNLVPSCAPCNQSKSGADWQTWMTGKARKSPSARGVQDVKERIDRLVKFEQWGNVQPLALDELAGADHWDTHWANLEAIEKSMKDAQLHAVLVQGNIRQSLDRKKT